MTWLRHTVMSRDTVRHPPPVCAGARYISPPWLRTSRSRCRTTTGRETKTWKLKARAMWIVQERISIYLFTFKFPFDNEIPNAEKAN